VAFLNFFLPPIPFSLSCKHQELFSRSPFDPFSLGHVVSLGAEMFPVPAAALRGQKRDSPAWPAFDDNFPIRVLDGRTFHFLPPQAIILAEGCEPRNSRSYHCGARSLSPPHPGQRHPGDFEVFSGNRCQSVLYSSPFKVYDGFFFQKPVCPSSSTRRLGPVQSDSFWSCFFPYRDSAILRCRGGRPPDCACGLACF